MRILPVNRTTVLAELANLDEALALFESLSSQPLAGVMETIPAARTVMIRFDPDQINATELAAQLGRRKLMRETRPPGPLVEIAVNYDGEDLGEVAKHLGITAEEVIRRHTESEYFVAFAGFAPGFAYLTSANASLNVPRRKVPRTRIPAGAVALGGQFSGIYPQASPGGWQLIGRTDITMFDLDREPAALLQPGFRVRFRDAGKHQVGVGARSAPRTTRRESETSTGAALKVLFIGLPPIFQDFGRPGQAAQGVTTSGALDRGALRRANRLVGNEENAPCLEITLGGLSFRAFGRSVIALTGAPAEMSVESVPGTAFAAPNNRALALEDGHAVHIGRPAKGMRSYLAARGGFAVEPVLGSASTDLLARIGPNPLAAGQKIAILPTLPSSFGSFENIPETRLPAAGEVVALDVTLGPRTEWFTEESVGRLLSQDWMVTPQTSRVGIRLEAEPLRRAIDGELPSEGIVAGAIQVPPSGQPILFLADHPLTGGYPVIAVVADHHLDLAGQIPIGARIRFKAAGPFQEITAGSTAQPRVSQ